MEKNIPFRLLEIGESFEPKYAPVLDFEGWRVAMLRHSEATDPGAFIQVERHNETNEVFILTAGEADLIICENGSEPGKPEVFPMRRNVAYNIRRSVWHHVVMSADAHIILFEKTDTTRENSDYFQFEEKRCKEIKEAFRRL